MPTPAAPPIKPPATIKQRSWRIAKRLLRSLITVYLIVCIVMYALQTKLIFPGTASQGAKDAAIKPAPDEELIPLKTPDGIPLTGWFGKAYPIGKTPATALRPTILFFYGNGDCMANCTFVADIFRQMGYHVMIVDYPGYGLSQGKPSEQGCYDAGQAAYDYILTRPDVDKDRLVMAGWSLGSAVAVEIAHRHVAEGHIRAMMTFCAFYTMVDRAQREYPFLPVATMLKHRFMTADKVRDLTLPWFLAHGKKDVIVPFDHADRLAAIYPPEHLTRFISETAGHNDFFDDSGARLKREMAAFLQRVTQ